MQGTQQSITPALCPRAMLSTSERAYGIGQTPSFSATHHLPTHALLGLGTASSWALFPVLIWAAGGGCVCAPFWLSCNEFHLLTSRLLWRLMRNVDKSPGKADPRVWWVKIYPVLSSTGVRGSCIQYPARDLRLRQDKQLIHRQSGSPEIPFPKSQRSKHQVFCCFEGTGSVSQRKLGSNAALSMCNPGQLLIILEHHFLI